MKNPFADGCRAAGIRYVIVQPEEYRRKASEINFGFPLVNMAHHRERHLESPEFMLYDDSPFITASRPRHLSSACDGNLGMSAT
jgi:hypothetical protein